IHHRGLHLREALENARTQVATFIHASSEEILFTSSGTEANNLAIQGIAAKLPKEKNRILISAIEHPSVYFAALSLQNRGFAVDLIPVEADGRILPEKIFLLLKPNTGLVCLHHGNHNLGTIQDIAHISEMVHQNGSLFFCDATTSGGWLPIDVQTL